VHERAVSTSVVPFSFDAAMRALTARHLLPSKYQCDRPRSTPFAAPRRADTHGDARFLQRKEREQPAQPLAGAGHNKSSFYKYRIAI
jgi:hypothetical protein